MRKDTSRKEELITALRLWYLVPELDIPYEEVKELYKYRTTEERSASQPTYSYPTCLCGTCGTIYKNLEEGFPYPFRQKCGLDNTEQKKDMKEKLSKLNTYVMGSLGRTIASLGRDFYEGELLEAFDNMNMPF